LSPATPAPPLPSPLLPLLPVVEAIHLQSPTCFRFGGRAVEVPPPETPFLVPGDPPLLPRLQGMLYRHAYCREFRLPLVSGARVEAPDPALVGALSAANAGRDLWQRGWRLLPLPPLAPTNHRLVQRGGERRLVPAADVRALADTTVGERGEPEPPGTPVALRLPREGRTVQRGYYFAFGDAGGPLSLRRVRFYWHLTPEGAIALLRHATPRLHRFGIPFQLKCPDHPTLYDRRDTAVLLVDHRHARLTSELLAGILPEILPQLLGPVPLFARPLAPGLGFAEDPGGGTSFGMHRCGLMAEALWDAHTRGLDDPTARLERVVEAFRQAGLDPHRPHLRGTRDLYQFPHLEPFADGR